VAASPSPSRSSSTSPDGTARRSPATTRRGRNALLVLACLSVFALSPFDWRGTRAPAASTTVASGDVGGDHAALRASGGAATAVQEPRSGTLSSVGSPSSAGLLRVTTEPPVPAQILVDGIPRNDWGVDWVSIEPGPHEVCFTDLPGYATPPCQMVEVVADQTTVVVGAFRQQGLLKIEVEPAGLPVDVLIDAIPRNQFGAYLHFEPGTYEVCGTDLPGWRTPECQTTQVESGVETTVRLVYGSARFVGGVSQRVLVDQFGDALFLVADAGWSLIGALDRSEIVAYLDLVVERGHNGVLVNLIEAGFSDQPPLAGEPGVGGPFTGGLFTSAPNEVYWAHVDWVIAEMAVRGLTAVANPAYAGFVDEHGVGAEMKAASDGQMEAFGRFIGGRYADVPNVVYQIGGDTTFDPASDLGRRYAAMANGIVAADATKVMTVMTGPDRWSSAMWDPGWLDFEAVYENDSADLSWLDLWGSTSRPLVYAEPSYEGSRFVDAGWSRWYGRRVLYVSFGFGYTGVIPGNCLRWHFGEDPLGVGCSSWGSASWADTLVDRSGVRGPDGGPADRHAHDTQRFVELVEGLPWPSMVPDTGGVFLTQGRGDGVDRASARVGGGVGYVYVPSARDVTVATTTVGGVVSLRWHDPTTGEVVVISTSETAVNGRVVSHPGPNSAGDNDWVLLVTAV
jgi:hypothetical protein